MVNLDKIADVIGGKRYEGYVAACCPFHQDKHPSFFIYEDTYYCKSCNVHGRTDELLDKIKGKHIEKVRHDFHSPWYRWLKDRELSPFCLLAHHNLLQFSLGCYLKKRKIESAIEPLMLGWMDGYYIVPIFSPEQRIIGAIARCGEANEEATGGRYFTPCNQEPMLYVPSWRRVEKSQQIFLVFGIIDAIILFILGLPVVTGSTGKTINAELLDGLRKEIIIIPDLGEEEDALMLSARLGWRGKVKQFSYPFECKDPADVYTKIGQSALEGLIGVS
jgi:DNA primase